MSWTVLGVVVAAAVAVVALAGVALSARPRRRGPADVAGTQAVDIVGAQAVEDAGAPTAGTLSRRALVQRGIIALFVASLAGVVSSAVAFLWPSITGHRGKQYRIGSSASLQDRLREGRPYYDPFGEFYVVRYPADQAGWAASTSAAVVDGMGQGLVAFSQKCTHLGCKVPFCDSSRWFECPCHGSRYNGVGEVERGPAPRGLDHYAVTVAAGEVIVDTRTLYRGPVPGTETAGEGPRGPHCY